MNVTYTSPFGRGKLKNLGIGQDSYQSPSVFSFFLPEFAPSGVIDRSKLVAPESQALTGTQVTSLLDGLFTSVKFGLTSCYHGFGDRFDDCPTIDGATHKSDGYLAYSAFDIASVDKVLDELSLLLTAGRLGQTNRGIIKAAIEEEFNSGNKEKAIRVAQQLLFSTPEFHSWGSVHRNSGIKRQIKGYTLPPRSNLYKSVVFFFMDGGVDSYNMVVPKGTCSGKDLYNEYANARQGHTIAKDDLLDIDATGSGQKCNTFGVNKNFPILKELYDKGEAMFFLNMGILCKCNFIFDAMCLIIIFCYRSQLIFLPCS